MKLGNIKFSTCGLICGIILRITWSLGIAQEEDSLIRQRRELQPKNHPLTTACTLYQRLTTYKNGTETSMWDCLLDPSDSMGAIFFVGVPTMLRIPDNAISGKTTLYASGMTIVNGRAISLPSTSTPVFGQNTAQVRTRRLSATGTKEVVVVRVTCGSRTPGIKTLAQLKSDVFSDASCLKTNIELCSNRTLKIIPGPLGGGIDVNIPVNECSYFTEPTHDTIHAAIRAVQIQLGGSDPSTLTNSLFMFCVPDFLTDDKRTGYGYINGWLSVFFGEESFSAVTNHMHEIGHNLGLGHGGAPSSSSTSSGDVDEYGDLTGAMGGASNLWDDERICYNAPHMYQLGWLKNVKIFRSRPTGAETLVGHTNFGGGIQALLLKGYPVWSNDTYIWFNHAIGINSQTRIGRNRVIVTTRPTGTEYTKFSLMMGHLSTGEHYRSLFWVTRINNGTNGEATIEFETPPTAIPQPSLPPTPRPTVPPTRRPVSSTRRPVSPTRRPVAPTRRPVAPTRRPVSPTRRPVSPTRRPVSPTRSPVSPTRRPVAPTRRPAAPTRRPVAPTRRPVSPTQRPVSPTRSPVSPTRRPVAPTQRPAAPTRRPVSPTRRPVSPTQRPVSPTPQPVLPTPQPMAPTLRPALASPTARPVAPSTTPSVAPSITPSFAPSTPPSVAPLIPLLLV